MGAEQDLDAICEYIVANDSVASASHVLDQLLKSAQSLATFPERGNYPKELIELGIRDFRQTFFKPYRLIYRVLGNKVYVHLIADGRQDMQSLLARRLLGA